MAEERKGGTEKRNSYQVPLKFFSIGHNMKYKGGRRKNWMMSPLLGKLEMVAISGPGFYSELQTHISNKHLVSLFGNLKNTTNPKCLRLQYMILTAPMPGLYLSE